MQNDLISRSALREKLVNLEPRGYAVSFAGQAMLRELAAAPAIDATPVVHGRWELGVPVTCSACGKPAAEHDSPISFWESPYCPWCGAKMDGGNER